jgi:hypothetical protein
MFATFALNHATESAALRAGRERRANPGHAKVGRAKIIEALHRRQFESA